MKRRDLISAGLALIPGPAIAALPAPNPDAEMIAAADRFVHLERQYAAQSAAADKCQSQAPAEYDRLFARANATGDEVEAIGWDLINFEAETVEGVVAKARAALAYLGKERPIDMADHLLRSLVEDAAKLGTTRT